MQATMHQWLHHFEYPHSRHEWAVEWQEVAHDRFLWQTVAIVFSVFVLFMLFLALWIGMGQGGPATPPTLPTEPLPYMPYSLT